jgi:diaminohydroxyphosphoribosylaminopyrimidine deaminase/5-amino-6-(5-phosphoribosylamino)uracil reductase
MQFDSPEAAMRHALTLAAEGRGRVEPNPLVGAVLVDDDLNLLGEGFHARYGGPHAEVIAIAQAGPATQGATLFVTLEPCAHFGKTPPCAPAVVHAGVRRVFAAVEDPFPNVSGRGLQILRDAGVEVEVGLLAAEARRILAPFLKLTTTGLPYVHAKWAMTIDGRIATRTGDSQWISGERSRGITHALRGRMDGIVVGIETAIADDPLLTARPTGPRTAVRIVFDSSARLSLDSKLVKSANAIPVIVVISNEAPPERAAALRAAGVEVLEVTGSTAADAVHEALAEFGRRRMTNLFVEGGGRLLGSFFDAELVDEIHTFIGPKVIGSAAARPPVAGVGVDVLAQATEFQLERLEQIGGDAYLRYARPI